MVRRAAWLLAWMGGLAPWLRADVIVLRQNQRRMEGTIATETADAVVLRTASSEFRIPKSQIQEIIRGEMLSEEERAGDDLAAKNQLSEALERYREALKTGIDPKRVQGKIDKMEAALRAAQEVNDPEALKSARLEAKQGQYAKAIPVFEKILAQLPESATRQRIVKELAQVYYSKAQTMKDTVQLDVAEASLRRAIDLDPAFRTAYLELAELLRGSARGAAEAKKLYAMGFSTDTPALPVAAEGLYRYHWGEAQLRDAECDGAVKNFSWVIRNKLSRDFPLAIDLVVKVYVQIGRDKISADCRQEIIKALSEAIANDPRQLQAHFFLGQIYYDVGRYKEALDTLDALTDLDWSYREAHMMSARCCKALNDMEGYQYELEAELSVNPRHYEALCDLGELLMTGAKYKEALDCFDAAVQANDAPGRAHLGRAETLRKLRRFDEARKECETLMAFDAAHPEPTFILGNVYSDQRQFEPAIQAFQRVVELLGTEKKTRTPEEDDLLARAYWKIGEASLETSAANQARESLEKAVQINPNLAEAYHDLAKACLDLGDTQKAEDCYVTALEKDPKEPDYYLAMAYLYHGAYKDPKGALPFYLKYLELGGRDRQKVIDKIRECGGDPNQKVDINVRELRNTVRQKRLAAELAVTALHSQGAGKGACATSATLTLSPGAASAPASAPISRIEPTP